MLKTRSVLRQVNVYVTNTMQIFWAYSVLYTIFNVPIQCLYFI